MANANFNRFAGILQKYPHLNVLAEREADRFLERLHVRYSCNDLHYLWSYRTDIFAKPRKMKSCELQRFYVGLSVGMNKDDYHLVVDCYDDSYIVCHGYIDNLAVLLAENDHEFIEIYLADDDGNLLFCVDHVSNVYTRNESQEVCLP